jgi:hypothetical protein
VVFQSAAGQAIESFVHQMLQTVDYQVDNLKYEGRSTFDFKCK